MKWFISKGRDLSEKNLTEVCLIYKTTMFLELKSKKLLCSGRYHRKSLFILNYVAENKDIDSTPISVISTTCTGYISNKVSRQNTWPIALTQNIFNSYKTAQLNFLLCLHWDPLTTDKWKAFLQSWIITDQLLPPPPPPKLPPKEVSFYYFYFLLETTSPTWRQLTASTIA